jgi:hypothetical protein
VKPKTRHLRIYGFLVYIHVPVEKREKIEPKKDIFGGYKETSKDYNIFIPA